MKQEKFIRNTEVQEIGLSIVISYRELKNCFEIKTIQFALKIVNIIFSSYLVRMGVPNWWHSIEETVLELRSFNFYDWV